MFIIYITKKYKIKNYININENKHPRRGLVKFIKTSDIIVFEETVFDIVFFFKLIRLQPSPR